MPIRRSSWLGPALAALMCGCGGGPEQGATGRAGDPGVLYPSPEIVKAGTWAHYMVGREAMARVVGFVRPIVAEELVRYKHGYIFHSDPDVSRYDVELYLDTVESGIDLGVWVGKRIAVVGHVLKDQVVGERRGGGFDVREELRGDVMRVWHIDVP